MMMESKMMESCQAIMEQKQKIMAEMKAQDAELVAQVSKMNGAVEGKKLDLLAAVVTNMVEQRTAMNMRMGKMENEMMQHMQMGKEFMSQCPMMKGMKDVNDKSAGKHKQHHEEQK